MLNIRHWLATRKAKRESEADPQWPGSFSPAQEWADRAPYRWFIVSFAVCALVLCAYVLTMVLDDLEYMQAMEDQHAIAKEEQMKELILQRKRQERCGGEEATVIELVHGGFACLDKDGRRRMPSGKP
jgi:cytochrome c-type biogenesis protein CcmH/NrfG